jgi:hypothetical protein
MIVDPPPVTSQEKGKSELTICPLYNLVPVLQKNNNIMTKAGRQSLGRRKSLPRKTKLNAKMC